MHIDDRFTLGPYIGGGLYVVLDRDVATGAFANHCGVEHMSETCNIYGGTFYGGYYDGCDIYGGVLRDVNAIDITVYSGTYTGCTINDCIGYDTNITGGCYKHVLLFGGNFTDSTVTDSDMYGESEISYAYIAHTICFSSDISYSSCYQSSISYSKLTHVEIIETSITDSVIGRSTVGVKTSIISSTVNDSIISLGNYTACTVNNTTRISHDHVRHDDQTMENLNIIHNLHDNIDTSWWVKLRIMALKHIYDIRYPSSHDSKKL